MLSSVTVEIRENPDLSRYEAYVDGELAGFAQYRLDGARMTIFHTEVSQPLEGRGIGSELARVALEGVRERGLELVPQCPFIAAYVRGHPDAYLELVPEPLRARVTAAG